MNIAAQARKRVGLTVEEAAKILRLKPSSVREYERCGCGASRALEMARLYRCPVEVFLYGGNSALAKSRADFLKS